ncbi:MAG TPA: hypothetical protein VFD55_01070 [Candidatus Angelobacter sp.]|nr:hypothetical protein [Candidatus Angelobacter sp.]
MKILIIGGTKQQVTQEVRAYYQKYIDFFKKSAGTVADNIVFESSLIDDLIISVGDGKFSIYDTNNRSNLKEYDVIFIRGDGFRSYMDAVGSINEYAHLNKIIIINDYSNVRDSSKLLQAVYFHKLDIPVARTLLVTSAVLDNEAQLEWNFPCIMKSTHGSHGNDNFVVQNMEDVKTVLENQPDKRFVLQRFVPNNGDYRILIIDDEILVIGRSAVGGSHLNNTSKGGKAVLVNVDQLPETVINDAKRIMKHFGMAIAGVDALADKNTNEFFFLEVNAQPQLMSGAFVTEKEKLIGKLLNKLSNES